MVFRATPILLFEDLSIDDEWESPGRTITVADVVNFAGLSGDFNAIHVDHDAAKAGIFRQPVAHGLLGLIVSSGLAIHHPQVETLALLAIQDWKFLQPIRFGDTVRSRTRVVALEPKAGGRRGLVTWKRTLINQDNQIVQEGTYQTLVRGKRTPDRQVSVAVPRTAADASS